MASLKEIKARISSVSSTLKITQAMKMVASAKLRKAQKMVGGLDAYKTALYAILGSLKAYLAQSPLAKPSAGSKVAVVVFSSHTALCGSYNANIFKALEKEIGRLTSEGKAVVVYPVGEKVAKMSRKAGYDLCNDFVGCADKLSYDDMAALAQYMIDRFTAGEFGAVELLYMHYHSAARQSVEVQTWLPVSGDIPGSDARQVDPDLIVEPSAEEVASGLLPLAMRTDMYATLLSSNASENACRMIAMQTASDNAQELLQQLMLTYNKQRQQVITEELTDISNGKLGV